MNQFVVVILGVLIAGVFVGLVFLQGNADRNKDQEGKKVIGYITVALIVIYTLYIFSKNN
jgi:hypothetical protein